MNIGALVETTVLLNDSLPDSRRADHAGYLCGRGQLDAVLQRVIRPESLKSFLDVTKLE